MESTWSVFVNGIVGVFSGMTVLYVTMKLISWMAGGTRAEADEAAKFPKES